MNAANVFKPYFTAAPAFSFAVIIIPMFDTLRVFIIRIYRRESPFKADRRHLHHILLDLGCTHLQSTAFLIAINVGFIVLAYYLNFLGNSDLVYLMMALAIALSGIAVWLRRRKLAKDRSPEIDS